MPEWSDELNTVKNKQHQQMHRESFPKKES
jgi:hypothetical protein